MDCQCQKQNLSDLSNDSGETSSAPVPAQTQNTAAEQGIIKKTTLPLWEKILIALGATIVGYAGFEACQNRGK